MKTQKITPLHGPSRPGDDWQALASCRGADASLFFSPGTFETPDQKSARESVAKSICAECPVRAQCLDFALATREPYGIWGGLNESERRRMIARRAG
ncbi:MAG: WhiB family transcriptional regulator [Actinomycetota bacterium]